MKLQKITQKRWFWPLVCAVSVVFGWWYLSIVTCAPLGGDDELINLQNYYYITHTSFGQSVLDYLGDLWEQFSLQNGRFRPFSSPPVRGLTSWFLGDLVGYRLYILAWTYADIVLTAWLVGKASRNKKLGIACLCLLPMMFSVWQDSTGNSLYSYGALVQSTLLPALVAGLAVLRWQDTGHKRWAVLAGYCMFQCCATFEIGFTYIVPIFGLAWLYTDKARDALRLSIPALLGECVTLAFNMGARLMNTLRAAGILAGSVSQIEGISPNFDLPAILRTWAMQMSAGFPLNAMLFGKMRPGKIYPVDVLCGVMVAGAAVAALAALDKLPNKKQNLLLFLSGLAMLSAPALLIGLSPKYQQPGQVDWRHGYIPQTVESFGVGLMALAVLVMTPVVFAIAAFSPRLESVMKIITLLPYAIPGVISAAALLRAYGGTDLPMVLVLAGAAAFRKGRGRVLRAGNAAGVLRNQQCDACHRHRSHHRGGTCTRRLHVDDLFAHHRARYCAGHSGQHAFKLFDAVWRIRGGQPAHWRQL